MKERGKLELGKTAGPDVNDATQSLTRVGRNPWYAEAPVDSTMAASLKREGDDKQCLF